MEKKNRKIRVSAKLVLNYEDEALSATSRHSKRREIKVIISTLAGLLGRDPQSALRGRERGIYPVQRRYLLGSAPVFVTQTTGLPSPPPPSHPPTSPLQESAVTRRMQCAEEEEKVDLRKETRAPGLSIPSPVAHTHFNTQLHFHSYPSRVLGLGGTQDHLSLHTLDIPLYHSQITSSNFVITLWGPHFL